MIVVPLSAEQEELARAWDAKVMENLRATPNYTGIEVDHRFFKGYLGELATSDLFAACGALFVHHVRLDGRSAGPEFDVEIDGEARSVEVKTAGEAWYRYYMQPVDQRVEAYLAIGAKLLEPRLVGLMGWLLHDEVMLLPIGDFGHGPTRYKEHGAMRDIADLVARLG